MLPIEGLPQTWIPRSILAMQRLAPMLESFHDEQERRLAERLAGAVVDQLGRQACFAHLEYLSMESYQAHLIVACMQPHMDELMEIDLRGNPGLKDAGLEPLLAVLLTSAPRLRGLDIARTGLVGADTPSLFELIKNSTSLRTLCISHNPVQSGFALDLAPALACNTKLEALDARGLQLNVHGGGCPVFGALWRHPTLSTLLMAGSLWAMEQSNPVPREVAELLRRNNVLKTLSMESTPCSPDAMLVILHGLTHNTGLHTLNMGLTRLGKSALPDRKVLNAAQVLLVDNVTLEHVPFLGLHANKELKRNMTRKCSRIQRAQRVVIALESLRCYRRSPSLRYIDRDIMRMVGRFILATKLRPEWEDPSLWPGGRPSPAAVTQQTKRQRLEPRPGDRLGPWKRTAAGDWVHDDDVDE